MVIYFPRTQLLAQLRLDQLENLVNLRPNWKGFNNIENTQYFFSGFDASATEGLRDDLGF